MSSLIEAFYNRSQPRNKEGEWTKAGGGPSGEVATSPAGRAWSGMSAHPDRRTAPVSKIRFPIEKDTYETQKEADLRFARDIFDVDLGGGYAARVKSVKMFEKDGEMVVVGRIEKDGETVGFWNRSIIAETSKRASVYHVELFIERAHQGQRLGDKFNSHAVAKYQELGVDRVELHAGDTVGGFAWARQGFRWKNQDVAQKVGNKALDHVEASPLASPEVRREASALRAALKAGEDVQPIHIASLGEREQRTVPSANGTGMWAGKRAMLMNGWEGVYYFDANTAVTASIEFYAKNQPRDKKGQWASTGATVSHIRGDIQRERKAILKELDAQGVEAMSPLRHIFERPMGNRVAVVRDGDGKVVGGVQYEVNKQFREVSVRDMRMLEQRQGHGTAAFEAIAKVAVENDAKLSIFGAVESAKPFYMRLGAVFQTGFGSANFTTEARNALASGKPVQGANLDYADWVKIDFEPGPRVRNKVSNEELALALLRKS